MGSVLDSLSIKDGMFVAEFGSGSGDFSLELAKRIPEGKVFALDVQGGPLSALKSKADSKGVYNIQTITCDLEEKKGSTLPDNYLDLVLIPNVLFQAEDMSAFIEESFRILKNGGKMLALDWEEATAMGPSRDMRVSKDEVKRVSEENGFVLEKEIDAGIYHWSLLFKKP